MSVSDMNLVTTVIGLGMSAGFIVFVCTKIVCGSLRRIGRVTESRIDLEQPQHRPAGLEPLVISAIPTMRYNREAFVSIEDAQCSICLGEYEEKEVLRIMPKCSHKFHAACVDVWLHKQSTCPVCRSPLQNNLETVKTCVGFREF